MQIPDSSIFAYSFCIQFPRNWEAYAILFWVLANTGMIPAAKQNGMTALKKIKLKKKVEVHDCGITCAFLSAASFQG